MLFLTTCSAQMYLTIQKICPYFCFIMTLKVPFILSMNKYLKKEIQFNVKWLDNLNNKNIKWFLAIHHWRHKCNPILGLSTNILQLKLTKIHKVLLTRLIKCSFNNNLPFEQPVSSCGVFVCFTYAPMFDSWKIIVSSVFRESDCTALYLIHYKKNWIIHLGSDYIWYSDIQSHKSHLFRNWTILLSCMYVFNSHITSSFVCESESTVLYSLESLWTAVAELHVFYSLKKE